jgi:hypothetical protein
MQYCLIPVRLIRIRIDISEKGVRINGTSESKHAPNHAGTIGQWLVSFDGQTMCQVCISESLSENE